MECWVKSWEGYWMSTNLFNPSDKRSYPSRWPLYRGKQLFRVIDERSEDGTEELLSVSHITGITPRSQKNVTMFQAESLVGYKLCQIGDIVANTMWTWQGAIGVSDYTGVVSPAYNVYRQNGDIFNPRFLDMLLRERGLIDVYHSLSTGIRPSRLRLYPDVFLTIRFPVPARDEQNHIVHYLDWKASDINRLIAIKRQQILSLNVLKSDIVKKLVFHGLNDSCPKMGTNFEWIGDIPRHWQMKPLKRMFKIISGATPQSGNPAYWDGDIVWITPADYKTQDKYILGGARSITEAGYSTCSTSMIPRGSIIFSKRAPVGTVAINHVDLCTNQGCLSCIPNSDVSVEYYYYLMSIFTDIFEMHASGTTFKEISATTFGNMKLPFPPLEEQEIIASTIDSRCATIDSAINGKNEQIIMLEELKNHIISNVVTGKIDVRGIEIPDYEYVADETDTDSNEDANIEETDEQEE